MLIILLGTNYYVVATLQMVSVKRTTLKTPGTRSFKEITHESILHSYLFWISFIVWQDLMMIIFMR